MGRGIQQVESEKIAFFTQYLDLTSQEAAVFWPVYNDFQNRKSGLAQQRQSISREFLLTKDNVSENEALELADRYIDLQVKEAMLAKEFHEKFKEVLAPEKVMLFYQAESEFRMQLLRRIRGGGIGGPGRNPGLR